MAPDKPRVDGAGGPARDGARLTRHSGQVREYQLQAVVQPSDGRLGVYGGEDLCNLVRSDLKAQTLFYDVFRSPDGREVVALQAAEFAAGFPSIEMRCNGRRMKPRWMAAHGRYGRRLRPAALLKPHLEYLAVWRFRVPRGMDSGATLPLEIRAGGQRLALELPPNPFADWARVDLTQHCVQRDYPLQYVSDHCLFYHRVHGYGRVVLYDNDSSCYAELLKMLSGLDAGLEVLVVRWPFRMYREQQHGMDVPNVRPGRDCHSQLAAYNHGFRLLRGLSRHSTNLDLDEYLCNRSGQPLAEYMARKTRLVPARMLMMERVDNVADPRHEHPVRAVNFRHQSRDLAARNRDGLAKYFYRASGGALKPRHMTQHHIRYFLDLPFAVLGFALNRVLRLLRRTPAGRGLPPYWEPYAGGVPAVPPREIVVYHYKGIRTDWDHALHGLPAGTLSFKRQPLDPARHSPIEDMPAILEAAGLGDPPGKG